MRLALTLLITRSVKWGSPDGREDTGRVAEGEGAPGRGGLRPPWAAGPTGSGEGNPALPTVRAPRDDTGRGLSGQKRRLHCLVPPPAFPVHPQPPTRVPHCTLAAPQAGGLSSRTWRGRSGTREQSGDSPEGTQPRRVVGSSPSPPPSTQTAALGGGPPDNIHTVAVLSGAYILLP